MVYFTDFKIIFQGEVCCYLHIVIVIAGVIWWWVRLGQAGRFGLPQTWPETKILVAKFRHCRFFTFQELFSWKLMSFLNWNNKDFCVFKHDRQTDGQNTVKSRCTYIIGIFTKNFSFLSKIAVEKIAFSPNFFFDF